MQGLKIQQLRDNVADLKKTRDELQVEVELMQELVETLNSMTAKEVKAEHKTSKPKAIAAAEKKVTAKQVCSQPMAMTVAAAELCDVIRCTGRSYAEMS